MFIEEEKLREMCDLMPNEFNRGYILALFHNSLISGKLYNELDDGILNDNHYREM